MNDEGISAGFITYTYIHLLNIYACELLSCLQRLVVSSFLYDLLCSIVLYSHI